MSDYHFKSIINATFRARNRKVTFPAMLLLWLFGGILIVKNEGLLHPWLIMKLIVLLFLSAEHGKLSKTPTLTLSEVAQILNKSPSTIERAVAQLKQQQKLVYQGPKKAGTGRF